MATLQIADKPTLDAVKQDTADILTALESGGSGGSVYAIDDVSSWVEEDEILRSAGTAQGLPSYLVNRSNSYVMYDNKFCYVNTSDYSVRYMDNNFVEKTLAANPFSANSSAYSLAVLNDTLYALGFSSNYTQSIYRYDKSSGIFRSHTTIPTNPSTGVFVFSLKNEIHIYGGNLSTTIHQAWDGSSWRNVTIPFTSRGTTNRGEFSFATNDYIYNLGTYSGNGSFGSKTIWRFDGTSWEDTGTYTIIPTINATNSYVLSFNNKLYIPFYDGHSYIYDGSKFETYKNSSGQSYSSPYLVDGSIIYYTSISNPVSMYMIKRQTNRLVKSFLVAEGQKIVGNNLSIISENLTRIDSKTLLCTATGMATISFNTETGDASSDSDRYIVIS